MIDMFNTSMSCLLAIISGYAVMSQRVRCGLLAHFGLVLVSLGFLGVTLMALQSYTLTSAIAAANALVHLGLVLIVVEYILRASRRGHQRRASDWMDLRVDEPEDDFLSADTPRPSRK